MEAFLQDIQNGKIVTSLNLSNCGLNEIPHDILLAKETLELLNLGGNNLTTLPSFIREFKNLRILFFANNKFQEIPSVLGEMKSLYMLSFKSNQLVEIPEDSLCESLGWLILTDNQISKLPKSFSKLTKMKKLMLSGNRLNSISEIKKSFDCLELLRLSGNNFQEFPSELLELPSLYWIAISGNPFSSISDESSLLPDIFWKDLTLGRKLGEGASATVFEGMWKCEGYEKKVAIKIFKGEITSDGRPIDEMKVLKRIGTHPNLIPILGFIVDCPNDGMGVILEYLEEGFEPLASPPSFSSVTRDVYKDDDVFTLSQIVHLLCDIASVEQHLHARGINHGDLYGHNILYHRGLGKAYLGDLGAATVYCDANWSLEGHEVACFGILMKELLDRLSQESLDKFNQKDISNSVLEKCFDLSTRCMNKNRLLRPTFSSIQQELENIHQSWV